MLEVGSVRVFHMQNILIKVRCSCALAVVSVLFLDSGVTPCVCIKKEYTCMHAIYVRCNAVRKIVPLVSSELRMVFTGTSAASRHVKCWLLQPLTVLTLPRSVCSCNALGRAANVACCCAPSVHTAYTLLSW